MLSITNKEFGSRLGGIVSFFLGGGESSAEKDVWNKPSCKSNLNNRFTLHVQRLVAGSG